MLVGDGEIYPKKNLHQLVLSVEDSLFPFCCLFLFSLDYKSCFATENSVIYRLMFSWKISLHGFFPVYLHFQRLWLIGYVID